MKKISIITVTLNCEKFIESTILSVIKHKGFQNIEYIIIDGFSTDLTCDIISKYKSNIDVFISEPDLGIFDAMNKGTKLTTADWILYLNAGDKLDENFNIFNLDEYSCYSILYGNTIDIGIGIRKPFNITYLKYGMIMACHQSMLFNKKILNSVLKYNLAYNSYNDFELVVRIIKNKFQIKYIDTTFAHYLGNGISTVISTKKRYNKVIMMYNHYGFIGILRMLLFKIGYRP
jgi:glycosyltransferase involved in cell wall biosynthesis